MKDVSVIASGDLMLLEPFPRDYNVESIASIIKSADVRITNLEMVISNWNCHASTYCGGQWINADSSCLDSTRKYGFNLYSCANNHSMDYSESGLLSTCKELKKRGLSFAGIGASLDESNQPAIMLVNGCRVAMISVTTTFIDAARAGNSNGTIPSRPGINPLRVRTVFRVNHEHFCSLKEIAKATCINGERDNARKIGSLPPEEDGTLNFGGHFFKEILDEPEGKFTYCDSRDLKRLLSTISDVRRQVDYLFVCVHSHQIKHTEYNEPDYFLEDFAHQCIDCGASAIFGGGTHQLKPIEIYKGAPIFYSLGNFVFQLDRVKGLPADFWDKYDYDPQLTISECLARKSKNGTIGLEMDKNNYLSLLPRLLFSGGKFVSGKLFPIELNFDVPQYKGLPTLAAEKDVAHICGVLNRISAIYGTTISMSGKCLTFK